MRPRKSVPAKKIKKIPGFATPCLKAYRGKNALKDPQIMLSMKAIIDGGSASRLKNGWNFRERFSEGMRSLLLSFIVMYKEPKDRPVPTRKRTVKLNLFMNTIPKYGPKAKARLKDK